MLTDDELRAIEEHVEARKACSRNKGVGCAWNSGPFCDTHPDAGSLAAVEVVFLLAEVKRLRNGDADRGLVPKELVTVRHDATHRAAERIWECLIGPNANVMGTREERIDDICSWIEEEFDEVP